MPSGQMHSYSQTLVQKRVVTDRIIMTDPMDIVVVSALGLNSAGKFMFQNEPGLKYEWLLDTHSPRLDAINGAQLTSDTTLTQMTVDNGAYFQIGDVVLVDLEYMWVAGVASNVLDLTRGYGGTQATHSDGAVVAVVGRNRLEGAAAGDGHYTEPTSNYNYSAILQKSVEISRSNALLERYGIGEIVNWEIDKIMKENMFLLNYQMVHGQRKAGSSTTPRSFGGLRSLVTTNVTDVSSAALTQKHIEDAIQDAWAFGGNPGILFCGGWAKRKIAGFYEGFVRTERSEKTGGVTIDYIESPLGIELGVAVDRQFTDEIFLVDQEQVGGITLDAFFYEDLAKTKDTEAYGQVVGEYGFVVGNEKTCARIHTFSTSA